MKGVIKKSGAGMHIMIPKDRGFKLGDDVEIIQRAEACYLKKILDILEDKKDTSQTIRAYSASHPEKWTPSEIELREMIKSAVTEGLSEFRKY